jgi:AcrR family transcriptional regulator
MDMQRPRGARGLSSIRRRKRRPTRANGDATRTRILDAAERLFAEHGYSAVSLRKITATAGVNVAAIHFHFASKEALFEALFNRAVEPINAKRLSGLRTASGGFAGGQPALLPIMRAFVAPHLEAAKDTAARAFDARRIVLLQFMARAAAEQEKSIQAVLRGEFDPVWFALIEAVRRALPDASEEAINWGLFFMLGALYYINPSRGWLAALSDQKCDAADAKAALRYLLPFVTGGLCAVAKAEPRARGKSQPKSRSNKRVQ